MDDLLARLDGETIHHLDGGRRDACGDDAGHRLSRVTHRRERCEHRLRQLGNANDAQHGLGHDAEGALTADDNTEQVVARRIAHPSAEVRYVTSRSHKGCGEHVMRGEPVLQAVRTARVLRDVPADGAHLLRRRVGCVEVSERPHRFADVEIGDARLYGDLLILEVDVEDCAHPAEPDDHAVGHREGTAGQAGTGTAGHERHIALRARSYHLCDRCSAGRQHHGSRRDATSCQAVARVRLHCRGGGDQTVVTNRRTQTFEESGVKHVPPSPPRRRRSCAPHPPR